MADSLSILASVTGVVMPGTQASPLLYTTMKCLASVPQTVISLSKELDTFCKAFSYLETIVRDHDISTYPQFPVDMLLELLDAVMGDLNNFRKILDVPVKQRGEGLLRSMWKQGRFVLKDEEITELRTSIAGYKATMNMTMTAVNLAIVGRSCGKVEDSRALIAELRDEIAACKKMIGQGSIAGGLASSSGDQRVRGVSGDAAPTSPHQSPRHHRSSRAGSITRKGDSQLCNHAEGTTPILGLSLSDNVTGLQRCDTNKTINSFRTSRAASVIDDYCDSLALIVEPEPRMIDGMGNCLVISPTAVARHDRPGDLELPPEETKPSAENTTPPSAPNNLSPSSAEGNRQNCVKSAPLPYFAVTETNPMPRLLAVPGYSHPPASLDAGEKDTEGV
ncbi:hypothetical protein DFP73DRAFT_528093 [Morchella snyderi]|nr:hypothetical protein DFP73DRAFT_528093 [Morchella snyderi]